MVDQFSEFVSLVRSIRVQHTLDLTTHLVEHEGPNEADDERSDNDQDNDGEAYTTWPLHAGDVVIPQWSLRDEIYAFARSITTPPTPPNPTEESIVERILFAPDAFDDDLDEGREALEPMPALVADFMSRLLVALGDSLTGDDLDDEWDPGHGPVGWQTVLNALAAIGADADVLENARDRLEDLYGEDEIPFIDDPTLAIPSREFTRNHYMEDPELSHIPDADYFLDLPPPADPQKLRALLQRERQARKENIARPEEAMMSDKDELESDTGRPDSQSDSETNSRGRKRDRDTSRSSSSGRDSVKAKRQKRRSSSQASESDSSSAQSSLGSHAKQQSNSSPSPASFPEHTTIRSDSDEP